MFFTNTKLRSISLMILILLGVVKSFANEFLDDVVIFEQSGLRIKISAINGRLSPNHAQQINVHPGSNVRFSADVFSEKTFAPQGVPADNFIWSEGLSGDKCNLSLAKRSEFGCPINSHFQAVQNGVIFHVPYDFGESAIIIVTGTSALIANMQEQESSDSVTLRNMDYIAIPSQAR